MNTSIKKKKKKKKKKKYQSAVFTIIRRIPHDPSGERT